MSSFSQLFYEFFANFCVKTNTIFFKIDQNGQNNEFEKKQEINRKKFPRNQKQNFREIEIYDLRLLGKFQPHTSNHVTSFPLKNQLPKIDAILK